MTSKHFDNAAAEWDKKSRRVALAEKISNAIARLPLSYDMDSMEFGCGTGLVGIALAPSLHHLTTIDTSQGMLDILQQKTVEQEISNITPLCCDLLKEDYAQKHDLIFSSMTLHHIQDTAALLQRFTELLNPGGYLALADLVEEDGSFHDPDAKGIHHKGFELSYLKGLLADNKMTEIKSEIIHTIFKSKETEKKYPVFLLTARKTQ